jgi:hypothetical protein
VSRVLSADGVLGDSRYATVLYQYVDLFAQISRDATVALPSAVLVNTPVEVEDLRLASASLGRIHASLSVAMERTVRKPSDEAILLLATLVSYSLGGAPYRIRTRVTALRAAAALSRSSAARAITNSGPRPAVRRPLGRVGHHTSRGSAYAKGPGSRCPIYARLSVAMERTVRKPSDEAILLLLALVSY